MAKVFSTEDKNLNASVRVVKELQYSDMDLSFSARTAPGLDGDIYKKTDAAAVKQSIKTLLLTNRFEKPYRPRFGANLSGLLFSLADENTGSEIATRIKNAIKNYEPRAEVLALKVTATPDYNSVSVRLEFRVISTNVVDVIDIKINETARASTPVSPGITEPVDDPLFAVNGAVYASNDEILTTSDGELLVRT